MRMKNVHCFAAVPTLYSLREKVKIPHSRMTKTCNETLVKYFGNLCYGTSHNKPFAPSVGGIRLLCILGRVDSCKCVTLNFNM